MITDNTLQLKRYAFPKTEAILKFIAGHDCVNLPDGEIEIEGRELFVRVMSYTAKPAQQNKFETHRVNADLQYIASGAELMQTARVGDLTAITDYDPKGDYQFYSFAGPTTDVIVKAGEFAVFFPGEAHRTTCAFEGYKGIVKKLVFKVRIS